MTCDIPPQNAGCSHTFPPKPAGCPHTFPRRKILTHAFPPNMRGKCAVFLGLFLPYFCVLFQRLFSLPTDYAELLLVFLNVFTLCANVLLPNKPFQMEAGLLVTIIRGGSRIFFRRGCTRLLLYYFNTNKPHSCFFFPEYQLY